MELVLDALDALLRGGVDKDAEAVGIVVQDVVGAPAHDDEGLVAGRQPPEDGRPGGKQLLQRGQAVVTHGVARGHEVVDHLVGQVLLLPPDEAFRQTALLGLHRDELLVVEGDPQLLGQLLGDLVPAGAELPAQGDHDLGLAAAVQGHRLGGVGRPLHLGLPLHKVQQRRLAHPHHPLHHKPHQQRGEHRTLPHAHQAVEIGQRHDGGHHHHSAVEDHLAVGHRKPGFLGDGQAHPLPRGRQDVGGQIEHHP